MFLSCAYGKLYMFYQLYVSRIHQYMFVGTASLDPRFNGKISLVGISFILITNFFGTVLGTVLCVVINPGQFLYTFF